MKININLKPGDFNNLKLGRNSKGITFNTDALKCIISDENYRELIASHEDNTSEILIKLYMIHLKIGGERNIIMDDIINEIYIEDTKNTIIHSGGNA